MYKDLKRLANAINCEPQHVLTLIDMLNVFTGKWRMIILSVLLKDDHRFTEIQNIIGNITPRMLSKELKELELNGMVNRKVFDTTPVLIQYGVTASAKELESVLLALAQWTVNHRKTINSK